MLGVGVGPHTQQMSLQIDKTIRSLCQGGAARSFPDKRAIPAKMSFFHLELFTLLKKTTLHIQNDMECVVGFII